MGATDEDLSHLAAATSQVLRQPAVLVEDLSYSSRAIVARLDLGGGETAIAKRPFERESFTSEVKALQILPADTRPVLLSSGDGVLDGGPRHWPLAGGRASLAGRRLG